MDDFNFFPVHFSVVAESSPGLLARLLQPLAKRDLTADAFRSERDGDLLRVEIVLDAMPVEMIHLVAGNLGQVIGVISVQTEPGQALRIAA